MISIQTATLTHLDELVPLFDAYRVFYKKPSDIGQAKLFLQERLNLQDSVIFIATDEMGRQVGFMQLYPLFSSTRMQKMWLLNDLFVIPEMRGKGISIDLINRAKEHCQDTFACELILETAKTNTIGNKLYPQAGFVLDTTYNHYAWTNKS